MKAHRLLWPETAPPELLQPTATREQSNLEKSYFVESTLPTSMLFAAIASQIMAPRRAKRFRAAASSLLHALIKKVVQSGTMKVRFTANGNEFCIPVPTTGAFPSATLVSMLGPNEIARGRRVWNLDAQDLV